MKIQPDCLVCIFRQTLEAARMTNSDKNMIREILNEYAVMIPKIDTQDTGPEIVSKVQDIIKEKTKQEDPYQKFKNKNIDLALSYYEEVKEVIEDLSDPLVGSLVMSAVGNSMDAGVSLEVDLKNEIKRALSEGFMKSDYDKFKQKLEMSRNVLFIADNAGEAVFDRLLINELNKYDISLSYAVREKPVLNDVTLQEAKKLGIDERCNLVSSGCGTPGLILDNASTQFKKIYQESDLRISKGQGNLEGLSGVNEEVFFLLKAKCQLVANFLQVEVGDLVFSLNE